MDPIEAQKRKLEEQAARRKSGELAKPVRPVPASTPEPPSKALVNPKVSPLKPKTGVFAKPPVAGASRHEPGDVARRPAEVDERAGSTAAGFRQPGSPLGVPAPARPATPPGGIPRPAPLPTPPAGVPRAAPATPAATARPPAPSSAPPPRPAAMPTPPGGIPRGTPSGGIPRPTGAVRPRVVVVVREKRAGGDDLATEVEERLAATKRWILGG